MRSPAQGTLAALTQAVSTPNSLPNKAPLQIPKSVVVLTPLETEIDEWNAPIDQDGSGRTALHDKFKGRY